MFSENPSLVQDPRDYSWIENVKETPLFLIHDGGGTTFSYHCLGSLDRVLYSISNPCYDTDKIWVGGIPEMARNYAKLIKSVHPRGPLILGGWSLGGMVSLAVARVLAEDPDSDVLGIVMVDSMCPLTFQKEAPAHIRDVDIEWGPNTRKETKMAVMQCFEEAGRMLRDWTMPTWEDANPRGSSEQNGKRSIKTWTARPPPAILLRALEAVPSREGTSRVDLNRNERLLGWDLYRYDLITKVVDIPGHHFNIFSTVENADAVTQEIVRACNDIELLAKKARQLPYRATEPTA